MSFERGTLADLASAPAVFDTAGTRGCRLGSRGGVCREFSVSRARRVALVGSAEPGSRTTGGGGLDPGSTGSGPAEAVRPGHPPCIRVAGIPAGTPGLFGSYPHRGRGGVDHDRLDRRSVTGCLPRLGTASLGHSGWAGFVGRRKDPAPVASCLEGAVALEGGRGAPRTRRDGRDVPATSGVAAGRPLNRRSVQGFVDGADAARTHSSENTAFRTTVRSSEVNITWIRPSRDCSAVG